MEVGLSGMASLRPSGPFSAPFSRDEYEWTLWGDAGSCGTRGIRAPRPDAPSEARWGQSKATGWADSCQSWEAAGEGQQVSAPILRALWALAGRLGPVIHARDLHIQRPV